MIGQCHRYVPYEIRPRYAIRESDSTKPAGPRGARSSATISAPVKTTTQTPRVIGDIVNADVPSANKRDDGGQRRRHGPQHRAGDPQSTSCGVIATSAPPSSWYTRVSVP